ncbi:MAG: T9SS type A sorting domain-containing protein [Bacteroidetes bacterium]|nr:T9SS type A sorting domain-containing protein [Bacteroidota bacterium]
MKKLITLLAIMFCLNANAQYVINTIAGTSTGGFSGDGGVATAAQLIFPRDVATDAAGNVYITGNGRIRKVSTNGIITTIAGNGGSGFSGDGGAATAAPLGSTRAVAVDAVGNVYIAETTRIRKVSTNGIITTIAGIGGFGFSGDGGLATAAALNYPGGVAVDAAGNVYIADTWNNRIRKVSTNGIITTIAGSGATGSSNGGFSGDGGAATAAQLNNPHGVAVDAAGNVYIADMGNNRIRKVSTNGIITTIAGGGLLGFSGDGGLATVAGLSSPSGVAVDAAGNVYITDNNCIRKVSSNGIITTIAGTAGTWGFSGDGGLATAAQLNNPVGVAVDAVNANVYIADMGNHRVRKVYCGSTGSADIASSATVICAGNSAVLTLSGTASSYTWSTGQTSPSISVSPATSSTYSLFSSCNISNHVSTYTATVTINVNPQPNISVNSQNICVGSSATISPTGGVSYTLNNNQTGTSFVLSPNSPTTYSVTGINNNGCTKTTTFSINLKALPSLTVSAITSTVCINGSATLIALGANAYTWTSAGTAGGTGNLRLITPAFTSAGNVSYNAAVIGRSNSTSCTNTLQESIAVLVDACTTDTVGIHNYSDIAGFKVYPNPSSEMLNVEWEMLNGKTEVEIYVYDILGNTVIHNSSLIINNSARVNVRELKSGIYFIKIGNAMSKFVKE